MRARNELLCSLEDVLTSLQPSTFVDEQLSHYKVSGATRRDAQLTQCQRN